MGKEVASNESSRSGIILRNPHRWRHPEAPRSSVGARDLPKSGLCSFVTDSISASVLKTYNALSQTILRLHHDQRPEVRSPIYRRDGQSGPPRLAAQEQTHTRLYS